MTRRALWTDLAIVAATKIAVSALVLAGGFRAVSDDDFARVVLAQRFAEMPQIDPTGTSWLPFPFWLQGSVMILAGTSLQVARVTALLLGVGSSLLIYAAARLLLADRRDALLGAVVAAILPWSARLGVATVPELPTAALAAFAVATLGARGRRRVLGGLALWVATLSRYEPWPLAAAFVLLTAYDAWRDERGDRAALGLAAALACAGPLAWLIHNAVSHGDAFHFAARVSAYWRAVGHEPLSPLLGYPLSLLREEPELCILGVGLWAWSWRRGRQGAAGWRRVAGVMLFMLVALTLAALPGAAPTHHAGRALLVIWIVAAIYVGAGMRQVVRKPAAVALTIATLLAGALMLRPWFARLDGFTARRAETAIGEAVRDARADPVLLEAVDYSYYAVMAGSGRPALFVLDRSLDPRGVIAPSSFTSVERLQVRILETGASHMLGRASDVTKHWGTPVATAGSWGLWRVDQPAP